MIGKEIGSEKPGDLRLYNRRYGFPTVPSDSSGVTVGIGYDLGMNSVAQIRKDWEGKVNGNVLAFFIRCAGKTGSAAKAMIKQNTRFFIPYNTSYNVFTISTLPRFVGETKESFPSVEKLNPLAQSIIVGLVYNRGNGLKDISANAIKEERRKEMRALVKAIDQVNYEEIAKQIESMARLWDGVPDFEGDKEEKLNGLVTRRKEEAILIRQSISFIYKETDLLQIE